MTESGTGGWTRRRTLASLAAVAAAPALPAVAAAPALPLDLARICIAAAGSPAAARLGAVAAEGRTLSDFAASLRSRLKAGAAADWRRALVESGRRDIAAGDMAEVLGRPLMQTEADVLAIGALLRGAV